MIEKTMNYFNDNYMRLSIYDSNHILLNHGFIILLSNCFYHEILNSNTLPIKITYTMFPVILSHKLSNVSPNVVVTGNNA